MGKNYNNAQKFNSYPTFPGFLVNGKHSRRLILVSGKPPTLPSHKPKDKPNPNLYSKPNPREGWVEHLSETWIDPSRIKSFLIKRSSMPLISRNSSLNWFWLIDQLVLF